MESYSLFSKSILPPHSNVGGSTFFSNRIPFLSRFDQISEKFSEIKIVSNVAMASGNKVITDPACIKKIQTQFGRKIVAFEMEAIGVAEACETNSKVPFIVIKSVSDFADPGKNDDWHSFCCQITADLALTLIEAEVI